MQICLGALVVEVFNQVGCEAAIVQYNLICEIAQRRYEDSLAKYGSVPVGFTALNFLHPTEFQERYILGLGIQLRIDEQHEVRERVLARCLARKRAT